MLSFQYGANYKTVIVLRNYVIIILRVLYKDLFFVILVKAVFSPRVLLICFPFLTEFLSNPRFLVREDNVILPKAWSLVYLPDFGVDLRGLKTSYVTTNRKTRINNTHLEMLNYALHWHVMTVRYRASGWEAVMDQANEYDMDLVKGYHAAFETALKDVPTGTVTRDSSTLIKFLLESMDQEGAFLRRLFPIHLVMERARKMRLDKKELP